MALPACNSMIMMINLNHRVWIWQIGASVLLHGFYGSPCMEQHDNEINLNYRVWIWQIRASVLLHSFYGSPCMEQQ